MLSIYIGIYTLGYIARFGYTIPRLEAQSTTNARMVLFSWASFILSQVVREPELLEDPLS